MLVKKQKYKFQILWSMRQWPLSYINWRLTTAYQEGWKFAVKHPIIFIKDLWNFLDWCQKIDDKI